MKLVHLKVEKEDDEMEHKDMACASCRSLTTLYLDAETLSALGINVRKLSPGDVMELQAKVRVSSVSEYQSDGEKAKASLSLDVTDIGLSKPKAGEKAAFDSGFDDE